MSSLVEPAMATTQSDCANLHLPEIGKHDRVVDGLTVLEILSFCPWQQRALAGALNAEWRAAMGLPTASSLCQAGGVQEGEGNGYWRFLCERLAEEHQIYVPKGSGPSGLEPPCGITLSWKKLFKELYPIAMRFSEDAAASDLHSPELEDVEEATFKIDVATRFRPAQSASSDGKGVVLPLHQQVQLVRNQFGCTGQEALKIIMSERQNMLQSSRPSKPLAADSVFEVCVAPDVKDKENVPCDTQNVNSKEEVNKDDKLSEITPGESGSVEAKTHTGILAVREGDGTVLTVTKQSGLRDFAFHRVFAEKTRQEDVYEMSARRLVMEFLNGKSASVICYGQTGSGKTYTMFSPPLAFGPHGVVSQQNLRGLVPRACEEILGAIRHWREHGLTATLGVSYVEIFGSEVSDLLREGRVVGQGREGRYNAVRATDRVGHRYVLDGHSECTVDSWEEVAELLREGDEAKRRAATAMNERSTRAHTVLVLSLCAGINPPRRSRFFFADLGGSEQVTKSKADAGTKAPVIAVGGVETNRVSWREYYEHRQRIQETVNINLGLLSLKKVIEALHQRSRLAQEGARQLPYVPYQDSKLTMILQEALGGSARTLVLATATMDPDHADESLQTLRFAEMCSQVQKKHGANQVASIRVALEQIAEEVAQLEKAIVQKERWETRLVRRRDVDTVAGAFGEGKTVVREEVIPTSVLVGAEAERERLERLLKQQRELEGLTGGIGKDYREMKATDAADGGRGTDFRENLRFSAKMKARDFENEIVLADAIRFLFRKAHGAMDAFGETDASKIVRLPRAKIPAGYFRVARALKRIYEDKRAEGLEGRSFGKAMMDRCREWSSELKSKPDIRDEALRSLLELCAYIPTEMDRVPISDVPEELRTDYDLAVEDGTINPDPRSSNQDDEF